MSILSALRTYLMTYDGLKPGSVLVDALGSRPTEYAIIPSPGARVVEHYINGGSLREFPFLIQSAESTADELARMENSGFMKGLPIGSRRRPKRETFPFWEQARPQKKSKP